MERNIARLPGVTEARLNFGAAKLKVWGNIEPELIEAEARRDGVTAVRAGSGLSAAAIAPARNMALSWGIVSGLLLAGGWAATFSGASSQLATGLFLAAIVTGGHATFRKALSSLARLDFNMNVLMVIAVTGAEIGRAHV